MKADLAPRKLDNRRKSVRLNTCMETFVYFLSELLKPMATRGISDLSNLNGELSSVATELRSLVTPCLEHLDQAFIHAFNSTAPLFDTNTVQKLSWAKYATAGIKNLN